MKRGLFTAIAVTVITILGVSCVLIRASYRKSRPLLDSESTWRLTYTIDITASRTGAELRIAPPLDSRTRRVFREALSHPGLVLRRSKSSTARREITLAASSDGSFQFQSRYDIHFNPKVRPRLTAKSAVLSANDRQRHLRSEPLIEVKRPVFSAKVAELREGRRKGMELLAKIAEFCHDGIRPGDADNAETVLQDGAGTRIGRSRAMVGLSRAARFPARLVTGFEIQRGDRVEPIVWVEVFVAQSWHAYDPESAFTGEVPASYLTVKRGGSQVVAPDPDVTIASQEFTLAEIPTPSGLGSSSPGRWIEVFDLTRLPLAIHETLSLMLLLPLGALATAVLRTIVGVRTFGTFTPAILAVSFVYTDWQTGIVLFAAVMVLGLATRLVLDRLQLLMVPRLSIMLVIVVFCIQLGLSLLDYWQVTRSTQTVLLPMVILAMMVERFFVATEEDGLAASLRLLSGTAFVAICCFLILRWKAVGQLLLSFPEIHFFTIAALVYVGRYTGYRLTELRRFADFINTNSQEA